MDNDKEERSLLVSILNNMKQNNPVVHCITNTVTMNDCANILLAIGASPIMSDDIQEVEEIVAISSALYINIGTLNSRTIESMLTAGRKANKLGVPVIFDPVGAGASTLRTSVSNRIVSELGCTVIRGNASEIKSLAVGAASAKGVDAAKADVVDDDAKLAEIIEIARDLSSTTKAIVAITGEIDVIVNPHVTFVVRNGNALMAKVTGTGCMLTALIAAYCGANKDQLIDATAAAICSFGLCGETAYEKMIEMGTGTSSYRTYIIDAVSLLDDDLLARSAKIEKR